MKLTPMGLLAGVAIVALIVAIGLFAAINSHIIGHYDAWSMKWEGPSPLLALIPLGIGVLSGIGALLLWGIQQGQKKPGE